MVVKNYDFIKKINRELRSIVTHPFPYNYSDKANAIYSLNNILTGKAYSMNVKMVYFHFSGDEYVALIIGEREIYKNLITCVTADSIPTMVKEAINDLLPYF